MEELRSAAIVKSLAKRSKIDLCVHGINKTYCASCLAKKQAKSPKAKKAAAAAAAAAAEGQPAPEQTV
jgi:hypothetical protein